MSKIHKAIFVSKKSIHPDGDVTNTVVVVDKFQKDAALKALEELKLWDPENWMHYKNPKMRTGMAGDIERYQEDKAKMLEVETPAVEIDNTPTLMDLDDIKFWLDTNSDQLDVGLYQTMAALVAMFGRREHYTRYQFKAALIACDSSEYITVEGLSEDQWSMIVKVNEIITQIYRDSDGYACRYNAKDGTAVREVINAPYSLSDICNYAITQDLDHKQKNGVYYPQKTLKPRLVNYILDNLTDLTELKSPAELEKVEGTTLREAINKEPSEARYIFNLQPRHHRAWFHVYKSNDAWSYSFGMFANGSPVFKKGTLKAEGYKSIENATTNALNELIPNIEQCVENNKIPKACLESLNNVLASEQWKINCEACKNEFEQLIPDHDFTKIAANDEAPSPSLEVEKQETDTTDEPEPETNLSVQVVVKEDLPQSVKVPEIKLKLKVTPAAEKHEAQTDPIESGTELIETQKQDAPPHYEPGVYDDISNHDYHASNGVSSSKIKDAIISLQYYNGVHNTKEIKVKRGVHFDVGDLTHTLTLQPELVELEYKKKPDMKEPLPVQIKAYEKWEKDGFKRNQNLKPPAKIVSTIEKWMEQGSPKNYTPPADTLIGKCMQGNGTEAQQAEYDTWIDAGKPKAYTKEPTEKQQSDYQAWVDAGKPEPYSGEPTVIAVERVEFWRQYKADNAHLITVDKDNWQIGDNMAIAVFDEPGAAKILNHPLRKSERSYYKIDPITGLMVKVRLDIEVGNVIGDLKTIQLRGNPDEEWLLEELKKVIKKRKYHLSAAMYLDVSEKTSFVWIFVNKEPGYHWVAVVRASQQTLKEGAELYRAKLNAIKTGYETGCWPGPVSIQKVMNPETEKFEYPEV